MSFLEDMGLLSKKSDNNSQTTQAKINLEEFKDTEYSMDTRKNVYNKIISSSMIDMAKAGRREALRKLLKIDEHVNVMYGHYMIDGVSDKPLRDCILHYFDVKGY